MQHCLLLMLHKWEAVDKQQAFDALLKDVSTAFDCINHNLLIAKLLSYRILLSSLRLFADYLKNRSKKRTEVESSCSC